MDEDTLEKYEILTNRSPFNNVIWHQEKSKRLLAALSEIAKICYEQNILKPQEETYEEALKAKADEDAALWELQNTLRYHVEEALRMSITIESLHNKKICQLYGTRPQINAHFDGSIPFWPCF